MDYGPEKSQTTRRRVETTQGHIDKRLAATLLDGDDIIARLCALGCDNTDIIEIKTELPSRPDFDILSALYLRWNSISDTLGKPVRVYAWCYNNMVENQLQRMVSESDRVFLTVLPASLKEVKRYA